MNPKVPTNNASWTREPGEWLNRWLDSQWGFVRFSFYLMLGALLSRAFAPHNIFPVLFLVFPLLVWAIDGAKSSRAAFWRGWCFGFGFFLSGLSWIGHSFAQQDSFPVWLAPWAVAGLAAALAIYPGLVLAICRRFWGGGAERILLFAVVWTLSEFLRGWAFSGFPWHLVGSAWSEWSWMLQSVAWTGVYGLTFLTVLAAAAIALLFDRGRSRQGLVLSALSLTVLVSLAFYGKGRLDSSVEDTFPGVKLRIVQANIPQREKWVSWLRQDHFDTHLRLSRRDSKRGKAEGVDILIWPETAVTATDFDKQGSVERWLVSRLLEPGSVMITGAPRSEQTDGRRNWYNSIFAVDRHARVVGAYDKQHLVPFGEYLPFEGVLNSLGLQSLTGNSGFRAGPGPATLHVPGVPSFSPTICYEAVFPGQVSDHSDRPAWILNLTNDAWFGFSDGPWQHLALARMRAVEEGVALVRSAGSGISAVIDPYGREIHSLGLGAQGVIDSPLPRPLVEGFASHLQKQILLLVLLAVSALIWFLGRKKSD